MYAPDDNTRELASLAIEGNIIDHTWPFIVTTEADRPDTQAIMLLAHIVYWYRPSYEPHVDGTVRIGKKYKGDLLQRSYAEIEKMLGLTKRQAQEAFDTLERLDLAYRELRTVEVSGIKIANVLFIRLNHKNLANKRDEYLKKFIPSYENSYDPPTKLSQPHDKIVMTNTYNNKENTQICKVNDRASPSLTSSKKKGKSLFKGKDQFDPDKLACFEWLKTLGIDTTEDTLSWWAKNYTMERLQEVYQEVSKRKPKSIGAYMHKLLKSQATVATGRVEVNREYAEIFRDLKGWRALEIMQKYANIDKGNHNIEIDFNMDTEEFRNYLHEKYESHGCQDR